MARPTPSALVSDYGRRVSLRIHGRFYELSQEALRAVLGLPDGPPGLGVAVGHDRLRFEFAADQQTVELTARQLQRRIAKLSPAKQRNPCGRRAHRTDSC